MTSGPAHPAEGVDRSDLSSLARSGTLSVAGSIASGILSSLVAILVSRAYGTGGAGQVFVAVGLFTILVTLSTFGADTGVIRAIARAGVLERRWAIRSYIVVGICPAVAVAAIAGALIFALTPEVSRLLVHTGDRTLAVDFLHILSLFLPVAVATDVVLAGTRGFGTMVPLTILDRIGQPTMRALLVSASIGVSLGGIALALSWSLPLAVELVLGSVWLVALIRAAERQAQRPGAAPPLRTVAREFWSFSIFRGAATSLSVLVAWLDVLLVGALVSGAGAGVYGAVSRLIFAGALVQRAVIVAMGPQVTALLARHEQNRARVLYQTATSWLVLASFPVFLTVAIYAPTVLRIFGPEFVVGSTALVIVALASLVNMATGPATTILVMAGRSSWNMGNAATATTLNVILNVVLIPRFGITGAAVAWAVTILLQNLLPVAQIWRSLDLHPFGPATLTSGTLALVCFGVVGLAIRSTIGVSAPALIVSTIVSTIAYLTCAWILREALCLPLDLGAAHEAAHRPHVLDEEPVQGRAGLLGYGIRDGRID